MSSNLFNNYKSESGVPEPAFAAALSVVPGLGQFYNGESRKGWLFFDVGVLNLALISFVLSAQPIAQSLLAFSKVHHFRANDAVIKTLESMHLGSPAANSLLLLCLLFVLYSVRDAYDRAIIKRRNMIYPDAILELSEAASGSYLIHFAMMVTFVVMAAFIFIPAPQRVQLTEIEFIVNNKKDAVVVPKTKTVSTNASQAQGKRQIDKPVTTARWQPASQPKQAQQSPPEHVEKTPTESSSAPPAVKPVQPPQKIAMAPPAPPRITAVPIMRNIVPVTPATPATPMPPMQTAASALRPANQNPAAAFQHVPSVTPGLNLPFLGVKQPTGPAVAPALSSDFRPQGQGSPTFTRTGKTPGPSGPSTSAPQPVSAIAGGPDGHTGQKPSLAPGTNGPKTGPQGVGPKPTGSRTTDGPSGPPVLAVLPRLATPSRGIGEDPRQNTNKDGKPGDPRPEAGVVPDFSRYLAELQRRIKSAWFPPKHMTSIQTKVQFTINRRGELVRAGVTRTSGNAMVDDAAMKAVRNASPFRPLPDGSPEDVDVEFTFDYNVFGGRGF